MFELKPVMDKETCDKLHHIPHTRWKASPELVKKYSFLHHEQGEVYHKAAVSFIKKMGMDIPPPRSVYQPGMLFSEQFFNYWKEVEINWNKDAWSFAKRKLFSAFNWSNLTPLSLDDVAMHIITSDKKDKSAGLPTLAHKQDVMKEDLARAKAISTGRVAPPPCMALYRTQVNKARLVWGYPLSVTLIEGSFMIPLIEHIKSARYPYTLGLSSYGVNGRLARLAYCPIQYCLDWSKFDSTVSRQVISLAFNCVKRAFKSVDREAWNFVCRYFACGHILMPDGNIYTGRVRGIPSGSWFTQLIGSMCNYFLIHYISYVVGEGIERAVVLGDDSVIGMNRMPNVRKWESAAADIGMVIHPLKQKITHGHPHYLGHDWGSMYPVRPVDETIQRICTSERFDMKKTGRYEYEYLYQKAKALLVDNPDAYPILTEFMAYLRGFAKGSGPGIAYGMVAGTDQTGTNILTSWGKAHVTFDPRKTRGFKTTIIQQMWRH